MPQNPRNQSERGPYDRENETRNDARRENLSTPVRNNHEQNVERGSGSIDRGSRSSISSSIDYDRNAE